MSFCHHLLAGCSRLRRLTEVGRHEGVGWREGAEPDAAGGGGGVLVCLEGGSRLAVALPVLIPPPPDALPVLRRPRGAWSRFGLAHMRGHGASHGAQDELSCCVRLSRHFR